MSLIAADPLFRYLVKFSIVENFYKRALRSPAENGHENSQLIAPLIIRDLTSIRSHVKQHLTFRNLDTIDFRETLIKEAYQDGAYILEKKQLSTKVFVHNIVTSVLRDSSLKTIENLQKKYLPSDYVDATQGIIGTKTQNAVCAGLRGARAYLIKQTAVGHSGCGKVCLFDQTGLRAEFFLKQDFESRYPSSHYFHPVKKIIGILNESPTINNDERFTTIITPQQLGIAPAKYLNLGEKMVWNVNDFLETLGV